MKEIFESTIKAVIIPLILLGIMSLLGMYLARVFAKARKSKCYYCKKQLGIMYDKGKTRYQNRKKEDNYAHTSCIPKNKLKYWRLTH